MKRRIRLIVASLLAVVVSIPTLTEGTSMVMGLHAPDQIVLSWLVGCNVGVAILSLLAVLLLWLKESAGKKLSLTILPGHVTVLLVLVLIFVSAGDRDGHTLSVGASPAVEEEQEEHYR